MRRGEEETRGRGDPVSASIDNENVPVFPRPRVPASSIPWAGVRRVLVVRLRSIGDTVVATPSLIALRRFLPDARIDILLEDWVAPLLDGFDAIDNVIPVGKTLTDRLKTALRIRRNCYDVVFNLHGGTTATFFTRFAGAGHRVGYANYQYAFLHNHLLSSASDFWQTEHTHSAEQQLALLGFAGVPVEDRPKSRLAVSPDALASLEAKLLSRRSQIADSKTEPSSERSQISDLKSEISSGQFQIPNSRSEAASHQFQISDLRFEIALIHPAAAFATKQWSAENFARVAEYLAARGIKRVAVAARGERNILDKLTAASRVPIITFDDLTLPEITALASRAKIFIGNDSGIAHIAAAVNTPSVVIFGSSNRRHWRPWTDAPNEIMYETFPCQPCAGYECKEFGEPRCILDLSPDKVILAINTLLQKVVHNESTEIDS